MLRNILYILVLTATIFLVFLLDGHIQLTKDPLPPFGKFLNPFGGVWTSHARHESIDFSAEVYGLKDNVEIIYDERRIPHIYAQNLEDALFAQGFVEAQNRLFQMQFLARAAAGELSEILGPKTFEYDLSKRRLGMTFAAENAVKGWEKQGSFPVAKRYMDGVNAYILNVSEKDLPLEFKLLNITPEEWTPLKSALIFKEMSLTLAGFNNDIRNTNLLHILGPEDFTHLFPERQSVETPVIPGSEWPVDSLRSHPFDSSCIYPYILKNVYFEDMPKGIGSNSWAVSGSRSATGHPIFCNDPHLNLSLPSIWFELHIHTPQFNAYGVSFPGFPGIMIGFNDHIAWGETNVGQDVSDHFIIQWADNDRNYYMLDGQKEKTVLREEVIRVKGSEPVIDTVRYTYWGPVQKSSLSGQYDVALRWLPHDEPDTEEFNTFIRGMSARTYDEYLSATEAYISPGQNFGFASKNGDIAMRINGRYPAKQNGDGRFIEWGNQTAHNWAEWIPKFQNPQIINPERGFITSANQVSAGKEYPYYFTGKFERYRNRIIHDSLSHKNDFSVADMKKMHVNNVSYKALDYILMLTTLSDTLNVSSEAREILGTLLEWDGQYLESSEEATVFEIFYSHLEKSTWDEILNFSDSVAIALPEDWRLLELIKEDPGNRYFDIQSTADRENAYSIIELALIKTSEDIRRRSDEGLSNSWSKFRPLNILHLMRLPALSSENLSASGSPDAINATNKTYGPSWRMIVSLEEKVKAFAVYPGGQSGNPVSRYYKNMIDPWLKGEYFELNPASDKKDLIKKATQKITLLPKNS